MKFKISESQYNNIISKQEINEDDIVLAANGEGSAQEQYDAAQDVAKNNGLDLNRVSVNIQTNESSILLTKKQIIENKRKYKFNNSKLYGVKSIMENINQ